MRTLIRFCYAASLAAILQANVKLPSLISNHMVLQQAAPIRIWGQADPGENVRVEFQGQRLSATADPAGKWELFLKPLQKSGPAEMTVTGQNSIVIRDVLVGEVWVGSGQSNMAMTVARSNNAAEEIAKADYPLIRFFEVKRTVAEAPATDVEGSWQLCGPETVRNASAVGYFFSRHLHQKLGVPIGFIHSSWGGTPAQAWTSKPALESEPALRFISEEWEKALANYPAAREKFEMQMAEWKKARAEGKTPPRQPVAPRGPGHPHSPSGLYNGMIAPLTPYAIRGVIWYQGESNASPTHAHPYRRLFHLMIEDWRHAWGEGSFPFLFVQLANFRSNGSWPVLRESQTEALELRNTGMAVITDIGESNDIHPKNKQDVGMRLALAARAQVYGEKIVYSGPMFRQATLEGNQLRVWFEHTGSGLVARGGSKLTGFTIAGKDGKFVPAEARIDGGTVLVSSAEVQNPSAVRYAWEDDPAANLFNQEGLPCSPFRSDR
jgi:sialate O-acetylesterase